MSTNESCQELARKAPDDSHHWVYPQSCFDRVHADLAEYDDHHFLVTVDAHCKWVDVPCVDKDTTALFIVS